MLASIHPLGERARNNRWASTAVAYTFGSLVGGTIAGALFGSLGWMITTVMSGLGSATAVVAGGIIVTALAMDGRIAGARVPSIKRQVDENWLNAFRGWVYGVGYGFQLGLAFDVIVTTAAIYATFALALLTGSVWQGAAIGAVFGMIRGITIFTARGATTPETLRAFHRRLAGFEPAVHRGVLVTEGLVLATIVLEVLRRTSA